MGAAKRVQEKLGSDIILHTPSALWQRQRTILAVPPISISNFSELVMQNCEGQESLFPSYCTRDFLIEIKGHACWTAYVTLSEEDPEAGSDMSLFHLLEDGDIIGWG